MGGEVSTAETAATDAEPSPPAAAPDTPPNPDTVPGV
jgi:hypothetical protein